MKPAELRSSVSKSRSVRSSFDSRTGGKSSAMIRTAGVSVRPGRFSASPRNGTDSRFLPRIRSPK